MFAGSRAWGRLPFDGENWHAGTNGVPPCGSCTVRSADGQAEELFEQLAVVGDGAAVALKGCCTG